MWTTIFIVHEAMGWSEKQYLDVHEDILFNLWSNYGFVGIHPDAWYNRSYEPLCKKECQTILYWITLVLMSFEVLPPINMDSQEPSCCDNSYLLGFLTK